MDIDPTLSQLPPQPPDPGLASQPDFSTAVDPGMAFGFDPGAAFAPDPGAAFVPDPSLGLPPATDFFDPGAGAFPDPGLSIGDPGAAFTDPGFAPMDAGTVVADAGATFVDPGWTAPFDAGPATFPVSGSDSPSGAELVSPPSDQAGPPDDDFGGTSNVEGKHTEWNEGDPSGTQSDPGAGAPDTTVRTSPGPMPQDGYFGTKYEIWVEGAPLVPPPSDAPATVPTSPGDMPPGGDVGTKHEIWVEGAPLVPPPLAVPATSTLAPWTSPSGHAGTTPAATSQAPAKTTAPVNAGPDPRAAAARSLTATTNAGRNAAAAAAAVAAQATATPQRPRAADPVGPFVQSNAATRPSATSTPAKANKPAFPSTDVDVTGMSRVVAARVAQWWSSHRKEIDEINDSPMASDARKQELIVALMRRDGVLREQQTPSGPELHVYASPELMAAQGRVADDGRQTEQAVEVDERSYEQRRDDGENAWYAQKQRENPGAYQRASGDAQAIGRAIDRAGNGMVKQSVFGIARLIGMNVDESRELAENVERAAANVGMIAGLRNGHGAREPTTPDKVDQYLAHRDAQLGAHQPAAPSWRPATELPTGPSAGEKSEIPGMKVAAPDAQLTAAKTPAIDYFRGGRRTTVAVAPEPLDPDKARTYDSAIRKTAKANPGWTREQVKAKVDSDFSAAGHELVIVQEETWEEAEWWQQELKSGPAPDVRNAIAGKIERFVQLWRAEGIMESVRDQGVNTPFSRIYVRQRFLKPTNYVIHLALKDAAITPTLVQAAQAALDAEMAGWSMTPFDTPLPPIQVVLSSKFTHVSARISPTPRTTP